jgi:hypothetical protein
MILYSIQWQASHGNWSCYANKPAPIWIMQIIKNLHSMTWCYGYSFATNSLRHAKKVELEYLADLRLCARCFHIQIALFLPPEQVS